MSRIHLEYNISNKPSVRQEHPCVSDGPDGPDGTSYPLTENQMRPVAQATGRVVCLHCCRYSTTPLIVATHRVVYYAGCPSVRLPLLCVWNVVMYTHHQIDMCVTLFTGLHLHCRRLPMACRCLCLSPAECHIFDLCYCYLSDAALSPICLTLRSCHLLQYSLHFAYIACRCICFAIIVFYVWNILSSLHTL